MQSLSAVPAPGLENWGGGQTQQRRREKHLGVSGMPPWERLRISEMPFDAFWR